MNVWLIPHATGRRTILPTQNFHEILAISLPQLLRDWNLPSERLGACLKRCVSETVVVNETPSVCADGVEIASGNGRGSVDQAL